jgi:hypothetical protein
MNTEADKLAQRQAGGIELECSGAAAFAGRGLVAQGEFERHTSLSDRNRLPGKL